MQLGTQEHLKGLRHEVEVNMLSEVILFTYCLTILVLSHDSVAYCQCSKKLSADGTLLSSEYLHQAGSGHEQPPAGVWVPA